MRRSSLCLTLALCLAACGNPPPAGADDSVATDGRPFVMKKVAALDEPWAMTFLPDSAYALVTERGGRLILLDPSSGARRNVTGVPRVAYGGQGGLGDVIVGAREADGSYLIYLSWAEAGSGGTKGAAVGLARLAIGEGADGPAELRDLKIIWRQQPKVTGGGHFGHRLALSPDRRHLFISSGERQKFDPAQDMTGNLGKIIRLNADGSVPSDNPRGAKDGTTAQLWSWGHRNPLGIAFDSQGRLWEHEMGPRGGDEVNLVLPGRNYGWPLVSNGDHYSGQPIPDHPTRPELEAPKVSWNPSISPAGLIHYDGDAFPQWKGSLLMGALSGEALIRIAIEGESARVAHRWPLGMRVREVEQGPGGRLWLLEDGDDGGLWLLTPPDRPAS